MTVPQDTAVMPEIRWTIDLLPVLMGLAVALCCLSLLVTLRQRPTVRHSLYWSVGGCAATIGLFLIITRGSIPHFASILVGNVLLIAGEALLAAGASQYVGGRSRIDLLVGAIAGALFAVAYFLEVDGLVRVTIYTISCAILAIRTAFSFFMASRRWVTLAAGSVAGILGLVEVCRAGLIYLDVLSPHDKAMVNGFSMMFGVPLSIIVGLSVLMVHRDRMVAAFGLQRVVGRHSAKLQDVSASLHELGEPPVGTDWTLLGNECALVAPDSRKIRLTSNEYLVLEALARTNDMVDRLTLNALIGRSTIDPKDRGIDILFSRLRRKCTDDGYELPVNALRGRGYIFIGNLNMQ